LSETGGPCVDGHLGDMDYFQTEEYQSCVFGTLFRGFLQIVADTRGAVVKKDMVTATAVVAALGSFFMGLLTNLPVAIAFVYHTISTSSQY